VLALHIHQFEEVAQLQSLCIPLEQLPTLPLRPQEAALDIVQRLPNASSGLRFVVVTEALLDEAEHAVAGLGGLVANCDLLEEVSANAVGNHGLQDFGVVKEWLQQERTARVLHTR